MKSFTYLRVMNFIPMRSIYIITGRKGRLKTVKTVDSNYFNRLRPCKILMTKNGGFECHLKHREESGVFNTTCGLWRMFLNILLQLQ